jgi:hypothetical protein
MAVFEKTDLFKELVVAWSPAVMAGNVTERQMAADERIGTRHKARLIQKAILESNGIEVTSDDLIDDFIDLAQTTKDAIKDAFVMARYHQPECKEAPGIESIEGVTAGSVRAFDRDAIIAKATAIFNKAVAKDLKQRSQRVVVSGDVACLVFAGDEHMGGKTDIQRMLYEAALVNDTPGMYHVRMGDIVNQFILGRMRAIRDNAEITIPEEWVLAKVLADLIAEKVVAWVGGNHDDWGRKAAGTDKLVELLPDGVLYHKYDLSFDLHVGKTVKRIRIRHQWKGSSVFNPTHAIEAAAQRDLADFDVAVGAHTHQAALCREFFAQGKRRLAVLTNTYKKYDDFPVEIGFPRSDASSTCAAVIFESDGSMFGAPSLEWAAAYMRSRYNK